MRYSTDEIMDGAVWNGFDYTLQVWVRDGRVQPCGHKHTAAETPIKCNGFQLAYMDIRQIIKRDYR
jgi:hypothetical protein